MGEVNGRVSKVLVAGPVGVGKTTAVRSVSDVPVLTTEERPSDETRLRKQATTVAMDFGVLRIDEAHVVHVYGTPGQKRFDFMWDILADGSAGVVLLLDASDGRAASELEFYLEAFKSMAGERRLVLGVTRAAPATKSVLTPFREHVERAGLRAPVLEADPRSKSDVRTLIDALLATVERS